MHPRSPRARPGRVSVRLNEDSFWSGLDSFALSYISSAAGCGSGRTAHVQTHQGLFNTNALRFSVHQKLVFHLAQPAFSKCTLSDGCKRMWSVTANTGGSGNNPYLFLNQLRTDGEAPTGLPECSAAGSPPEHER